MPTALGNRALRISACRGAWSEGSFAFTDPDLAHRAARDGENAAWLVAFERYGSDAPAKVSGNFAVAANDGGGRIWLAVDRFAIRTLCYRVVGGDIDVHERADVVAASDGTWDSQALFNYLYFHVIPAPTTIFRHVRRLPAGHCATVQAGRVTVEPWWKPKFVEDRRIPFEALQEEFLRLLRDAVRHSLTEGSIGCFLSGGTDSSTVAGLLSEVLATEVPTFSIGFDTPGYDEMAYARIAARHFRTDHHEYYVTPDDLVENIPKVAASFDQPFGNSSVLPAYLCAKLAADAGISAILAGDGGDELFGGNSRYAKQRVFDAYGHVPAAIRRLMVEPLMSRAAFANAPVLRKLASYVEQARLPMPDRLQIYNLLVRLGLGEVLAPDFLASINADDALELQREVYRAADASSPINRTLAFDWRFTLAENDLPKVIAATSLAGIPVGFPMLDEDLVDFSLDLPPSLKVEGLRLRWFFRQSLRGFLPEAIIEKKKHGFGLPFGSWLVTHAPLQELARESLSALKRRGLVRKDFIDRLMRDYLPRHPAYFGEMIWILMMLEQWARRFESESLSRSRRVGTEALVRTSN